MEDPEKYAFCALLSSVCYYFNIFQRNRGTKTVLVQNVSLKFASLATEYVITSVGVQKTPISIFSHEHKNGKKRGMLEANIGSSFKLQKGIYTNRCIYDTFLAGLVAIGQQSSCFSNTAENV